METVDSVPPSGIVTGGKIQSQSFYFLISPLQKLNHVMLAMAQLLNIQMPGSYELSFPPQNPDMAGFEGPGKGPSQSGTRVGGWLLSTQSGLNLTH